MHVATSCGAGFRPDGDPCSVGFVGPKSYIGIVPLADVPPV